MLKVFVKYTSIMSFRLSPDSHYANLWTGNYIASHCADSHIVNYDSILWVQTVCESYVMFRK